MVLDQLVNSSLYRFSNPRITRGIEFLQSTGLSRLPLGRIEIDGDHVFALVQEYPTRAAAECFWEAHRKYIDIQFLVVGVEQIDHAPVSDLQITEPYDPTKDRMILQGDGSILKLTDGMFAIFFPHDAHRPCMAFNQPEKVRKIVLKVAVNAF